MKILDGNCISKNPDVLTETWEELHTFLLAPAKTSATAEWMANACRLLPRHLRDDHFGLLTSGSTGSPKLVIANRDRASRLVNVIHAEQALEAVQETIVALPLTYSYAFVNQWLWSHVNRREMVVTGGLAKPDEFRKALEDANQAMICLVGSQVPMLLSTFKDHTFPGVTRINFAGGRFPQESLPKLKEIFPAARIFNNYGCAEAMPRLAIRSAEASDSYANIGKPISGVALRRSESGEITFRSDYAAVAAIEGERIHTFANGMWLGTGDVGEEDSSGNWMLTGRLSEVFKRYGEKISLQSVVGVVQRHWSGLAYCYLEIDAMGEQGYVLAISPLPCDQDLRAVLLAIRKSLPRAAWPLRIVSVDRVPLLENGKVDVCRASTRGNESVLWSQRGLERVNG